MNVTDALTHHVGHHVRLDFSDGGYEIGQLIALTADRVSFKHTYTELGVEHAYTAEYTLTGDEDTPHVIGAERITVQAESLF